MLRSSGRRAHPDRHALWPLILSGLRDLLVQSGGRTEMCLLWQAHARGGHDTHMGFFVLQSRHLSKYECRRRLEYTTPVCSCGRGRTSRVLCHARCSGNRRWSSGRCPRNSIVEVSSNAASAIHPQTIAFQNTSLCRWPAETRSITGRTGKFWTCPSAST